MADFTAVTHGFAPQSNMAEIVNAVNERRAACISARYGFPPSLPPAISVTSPQSFQGGDAKPTHLLIQEMLEALAPYYVDHDAAYGTSYKLTPESPISIPLPYFTLETWRSRAGLPADGFRRATSWANPAVAPNFTYGNIQTGDIAGYWIWEDIVKGLKALKWNVRYTEPYNTANQIKILGLTTHVGTPAEGIAAANAAWDGAPWVADSSNIPIRNFTMTWVHYSGTTTYSYAAHRCKPVFKISSAPLGGEAAFMALTTKWAPTGGFFDIEGEAENTWHINQSVSFAAGATGGTGSAYTIPAPAASPYSSVDWSATNRYSAGSSSNSVCWLIKWNFSHS
jgi:hypothetical protein